MQIPSAWPVCCWLTETISTCLLRSLKGREIFEKLINALTHFYEEAKAPIMLKSIIFTLLARLLIKLRHFYLRFPEAEPKDHFSRIYMTKDFI